MADKYGKILARRAVYVVIAFVLVSLCPSHYNEMRFFGILSGELTIRLVFIRAFTLIPILGLLVSYLVCGAIGFGSGLRHRPGKKLTAASLAIAAVMLLGGLYISCLTHPTTGGVTASFASLGDIMLAEPGALIGFAGPRVIEQTIGEKLPKGFQTAEFQTTHGFVDQVVPRAELKRTLALLLQLHTQGRKHGA